MIDLKGHAALVTGSTMGIGRAIVEACAAAGADVVVHGLPDEPEAADVVERCRELGAKTSLVRLDLLGPTEQVVEDLFGEVMDVQPDVDMLVNNAGQYFDVPFEEMTVERFEKTVRLNVTSGYFLTQKFSQHWFVNSIPGRVLFTSSINGRLAEIDSTAYDTSKGAVEMMVRTLAVTLIRRNIRVNGIAPGLIHTPQNDRYFRERSQDLAWAAYHTPNGRIPQPNVCGDAAVYLLSDAAEHVVGHTLAVDGGMTVWQHPWSGPWKQDSG